MKKFKAVLSLLVVLVIGFTSLRISNIPKVNAAAANLTSIGLAEHAFRAFNEKWTYVYGAIGENKSSDCSGLIYAYFKWNGTSGTTYPRQVNEQVWESVQKGSISNMPRVHGLLISVPDPYDIARPYSHDGVYVGNGKVIDNSAPGVNMRLNPLSTVYGWTAWHMSEHLNYPTNGWYAFNGNMYHYTNREYDINKEINYNGITYTMENDGIVRDASSEPIPVNSAMPNDGFSAAAPIAGYGDNGGGNEIPNGSTAAEVIGNSVAVRSEASTKSNRLALLNQGSTVYVTETVTGETVTSGGTSSDKWYKLQTSSGVLGYMTAVFVKLYDTPITPTPTSAPAPSLNPPQISGKDGFVSMSTNVDGAVIYYSADGKTLPSTDTSIYTSPVYHSSATTYQAVAVNGDVTSDVSMLSVMSNGREFKDLSSSSWYFDFVDQAVSGGIFYGKDTTIFDPESPITRVEFLTGLANLDKATLTNLPDVSFTDVSKDSWYYDVVSWAYVNNIARGNGSGNFLPTDVVSREQICVILKTYLDLPSTNTNQTSPFADDAEISSWAKDAVYACRDYGLVFGKDGNMFDPAASSTRAESSVFLVRSS